MGSRPRSDRKLWSAIGLARIQYSPSPDAHALSTSRASFNYRSWWIMNLKSLKQMSLSDPGLLAAQRGKRLWAKLGKSVLPTGPPCRALSIPSSPSKLSETRVISGAPVC